MKRREIEKEYKKSIKNNSLVDLKDYQFKDEPITVSVLCLCYNHEKYIKRCIESFLKQKVNFNVEILIHDDASTDSSQSIIKKYSELYPFIKPVFQKENQYSKGVNIENSILSKIAKGKYIAICEGDDYWTDPYKIITQVNLFESHPDVHFIVHKTGNCDINGNRLGFIPGSKMKSGIYQREDVVPILIETYLFHTTSYMFKTEEYKKYCENLPLFAKEMSVGDYALQLYFSNLGNIIFINKEMSAHVHNVPGSWTDKSHKNDYDASIKHQEEMNHCMKLFDEYSSNQFHLNLENRINKFEMHKLYHEQKYTKIVCNKEYSKALKKYDFRSWFSINMMVKHSRFYSFLLRKKK